MKKILLLVLLFLFDITFVNAQSDYLNDYTLIDCINWDNKTWVAFDSTKPFSTLKWGIESTINYINSNINFVWNESNASWKNFKIKVNCSFNDILNSTINLNFLWINYNNELTIEWIWEKSLIFKDTSFQLSYNAWNIIFKNAIFSNENKPYFYDEAVLPAWRNQWWNHPLSNGIKIVDSYIQLKNWQNLWNIMWYSSYKYYYYTLQYDYLLNYTNKQMIENSLIDVEISKDFTFRMPVSLKNSKINFTNTWAISNYNITFAEDWNPSIKNNLNYSVFVSNEIDLWWNNFLTEDTTNIAFLNNKFTNFNNFNFWGQWIFINNFIDNIQSIDISAFHNLYNNVFKSGFTDSYDIFNYRKNYSFNNIWNKWLGWVYKRLRDNKYFNIDINSAWLYKEVTWKDLPSGLSDIYVIFNY